jgi:DMSO/TMAO reductase YedYZ heme-binding membrane subunit
MTSNQRNWAVFVTSTGLIGILAAAYLAVAGVSDDSVRLTLRFSARIAFLVLLVIFVARPIRQMFATPATAKLLKHRRLLGIAFSGIHTAHLGLIFYRARMIPDFNLNISESLLGGLTYVVIYLMFLTSFDATARALGSRNWRVLHKVGLYWVFVAFVPTLLPESRDQLAGANGLIILLTAVAIVIRLTAFLANRRSKARPQ